MSEKNLQTVREDPRKLQRAFLVGIEPADRDRNDEPVDHMLDELAELLQNIDIKETGRISIKQSRPQPRYLIGTGKAREICRLAADAEAEAIVFDDPLSPAQQRNWEQLSNLTVIDRQEIILDIFAQRASTKEAELQVALARATYELPRLKRRWTHLSRQRGMKGGMGMRGEGEQQLEIDARLVQQRIKNLRKQLKEVGRKREEQRKKRLKRPLPNCAIVGYTNAGKSSLLNLLTGSEVFIEDKLFATLDPTTRCLELPNRQKLLISDTVGFIRKLPHLLVDAFKATLEEAILADFIIEVIDINTPYREQHHQTTLEVLKELGAHQKRMITVFNKIDLLEDEHLIPRLRRKLDSPLFVSAVDGQGLEELKQRLIEEMSEDMTSLKLHIPYSRYEIMAMLHRHCEINRQEALDQGLEVVASVPFDVVDKLREFTVE